MNILRTVDSLLRVEPQARALDLAVEGLIWGLTAAAAAADRVANSSTRVGESARFWATALSLAP